MASFYLADQCCELLLFLLALKELPNRSATACVGHIGQLPDAIVQFLIRTNHESVLVHFGYCDGVFGEAPNTKLYYPPLIFVETFPSKTAQAIPSGHSPPLLCRPELPINQRI